jgi:hypothetical protein
MLLCESVCTHYTSPVSLCTLPLPWVWCSCCSVSLSVHNNPPLGLVLMLLCESVCTHYPSTGFGVHVALWVCLYTITPPGIAVHVALWVCLYTITLPWDWCSCCSVSVCTQFPSPGCGVHVALCLSVHTTPPLWVCLCTLLLPVSLSTHYPSIVSLSVHNPPPLWVCLYTLLLLCESACTHYSSPVSLSVHTTPPLWVYMYTIPLPWVWYSCCSVFWFLCNALLTIVCLFDFLMPNGDISITLRPSL